MKYEIMIILKPLLPEDIRFALQKKIENILKGQKGSILAQDVWGKKHLAYPIKKHDEGYYVIYQFETESDNIAKVEKTLNLTNDVLRFLISKQD